MKKTWLVEQLAAERRTRESVQRFSIAGALTSPTIWAIAVAGTGINMAAYGLILFSAADDPCAGCQQRHDTLLVNAIPFAVAAVVMVFWSIHSDLKMERNWHAAIPAACARHCADLVRR